MRFLPYAGIFFGEAIKNFLKITTSIFLFYCAGIFFFHDSLTIPTDTAVRYSPVALSLLAYEGYSISGTFFTAYPPLYPLFLAAFFQVTGQAGTANVFYPYLAAALQSFSCGLIYLTARFYLREKTALASSLLLAVYPFFLVLSVTRYAWAATPLFTVLFYAGIFFFTAGLFRGKKRFFVFSGFLLGAGSMVWPGGGYVFVPLSAVLFLKSPSLFKKSAAAACFLTAFWILPLIWQGYAFQNTGKYIMFSSNQTAAMRDGLMHGKDSKLRDFPFVQQAVKADEQKLLKTSGDVAAFYVRQAVQEPVTTFRFILYKALRAWYGTDSEKYENVTAAVQSFYLLLALYGAAVCLKNKLGIAWLLLVILYFWLVSFSVLSILRYMIPAMGLLMIFAAAGLENIYSKLLNIRRPKNA